MSKVALDLCRVAICCFPFQIIFLIVFLLIGESRGRDARITSSPIDYNSTVCSPVTITCTVADVASLSFFIDEVNMASFTYFHSFTYPRTIYDTNDITIVVTEAVAPFSSSDFFNGTAVLTGTTLAISRLDADNIRCGTNAVRSQYISLRVDVHTTPPFECSVASSIGALAFSIQWSSSFTSQHAVERYRVSVSPDPSSCTSDQVSPSQLYTCSDVTQGTYSFTISAFPANCSGLEGDRISFVVQSQVPQIPQSIEIVSLVYDHDLNFSLVQAVMQWAQEPQTHISENCTIEHFNYTIALVESSSGHVMAKGMVMSDSCSDNLCNAALTVEEVASEYQARLTASNGVGQSRNVTSTITNPISSLVSTSVDANTCTTTVNCSSFDTGNWSIAYGQDPTYQDLRPPIQRLLNSPINLPSLEPDTLHYFLVNVSFNSTYRIGIRGSFTTEPCENEASLTSEPSNLQGSICQSIVMTCSTQQLQTLQWYFDERSAVTYTFSSSTSFPHTIYQQDGITIVVMRATPESSNPAIFNSTSVLTTTASALSFLGISNIQCGSNTARSHIVDLTRLVQGTVPAVPLDCSITPSENALDVSIQWSSFFTSQHAVERYRVSVSPDPSSCSSDQVSPNQKYTCPGLVQGTLYNFTVSSFPVKCSVQEGERIYFQVRPQVPQISEVRVVPVYDHVNLSLFQVLVEWNLEPQVQVSENCIFRQLNYTVDLVGSSDRVVRQSFISSDNCTDTLCRTTLTVEGSLNGFYEARLTASNGIGQSVTSSELFMTDSIMGLIRTSIDPNICDAAVTCYSPEIESTCSIAYGQDPSYENLSSPIQTSLSLQNPPVILKLPKPSTLYYSLITVTINSTLIQIRGNFTTGFAGGSEATLVVGVVFFFIATTVAVILAILEATAKIHYWWSVIVLVIIGSLLVLCAILWISVSAHIMPQENLCDLSWRFSKDGLVNSALFFSLLALIVTAVAAITKVLLRFKIIERFSFAKIFKKKVPHPTITLVKMKSFYRRRIKNRIVRIVK